MLESFFWPSLEEGKSAQPEQDLSATLEGLIDDFRLESTETKNIDLTHLDKDEVVEFFQRLVASGSAVLHGSSAEEPLALLAPQGEDSVAHEEESNPAVYATTDPAAALMRAIFGRIEFVERLGRFVTGADRHEQKLEFKVPQEIYQMFVDEMPELVGNGHVYVLDRGSFHQAGENGGESDFYSEQEQVSKAICKISKGISRFLVVAG